MLEKRFIAVPPQLFLSNGTANGIVTIADTSLFKVKQEVIISATLLPNLDQLEVKRVLSPTQMIVGPRTGAITTFTDISLYTTAATAFIFANEQKRPNIISDEFERAVYEEEPTVAKRVIVVDKYGNKIDELNPFPVDAQVTASVSRSDTITTMAIPVVAANTEYTLTMSPKTRGFSLRIRDSNAVLKIAFTAGDIALGNYITVLRGVVFSVGDIQMDTPFSVYYQTDKPSVTLEVYNQYKA